MSFLPAVVRAEHSWFRCSLAERPMLVSLAVLIASNAAHAHSPVSFATRAGGSGKNVSFGVSMLADGSAVATAPSVTERDAEGVGIAALSRWTLGRRLGGIP
jgi:hypothetical protein